MAAFRFECFHKGETPFLAETIDVPARAIWRHVEELALRVGRRGAFIRVSNDKGQAVVRAGVKTALAFIETCPCERCEIKKAVGIRL
jgi:hypothetical protein